MGKYGVILVLLVFGLSQVFAGAIAGKVTDKQSGDPLVGANVFVEGTTVGSSTDTDGMYYFEIEDGAYQVTCSFIGYDPLTMQVTVDGETAQANFGLNVAIMKTSEIIVEASRAKERETPVAFTDIGADDIRMKFTIQDVPHLFKNTPGIYVTSDGGSGMGDSKVSIRGFDEQRISVMINNIEVNDPESKKVYWSNWGALPSGSQSIQVQRGAGSSLYGAGAFGGSINILTADAPAVSSLAVNATAGLYSTFKVGADYNTGLFANNKMAFLTRINYQEGNGWRKDTFYRGLSYYFGLSWFPSEKHTFRVVLHGAPQYHAYAYYSNLASEYAKYGRDFNSHPFVRESDNGLTSREKDGTSLVDILFMGHVDKDKGGEVIGNGEVSFDNNVFHKPQFEIHHTWDLDKSTYLQTNFFGTMGRGYGENVQDAFKFSTAEDEDWIPDAAQRPKDGILTMDQIQELETYQYRAHSIHNQAGIVMTYNTKWLNHDLSVGAEGRYWWARHYGLVTNVFGGKADTLIEADNIKIKIGDEKATFREGDVYYDYSATKPNFSIFGHALWRFDDLSIMTDLQFASRIYNIKEDFPSSNNRPVDNGDYILKQTHSGGNADGFVNNSDTSYTLLDYNKTYNFISPKLGLNYNIDDQWNLFGNYSRVYNEPRVKYFFNYGQPNDDLDIEISDDFEIGLGFMGEGFDFKVNIYRIEFQNKAYQIRDRDKSNQAGYDYKGRRYVTVGDATYKGIEFASNIELSRNLQLGLNVTSMENAWGDNVSEEARDELGIEEGKIAPETPQFMMGGVVNYINGPVYVSASVKYLKDYYILPSNDYMGLEYDTGTETVTKSGATLPSWAYMDLILGWQQKLDGINLNASFHINNLFDTNFYQIGNKYGILPGLERNVIFNLVVGM